MAIVFIRFQILIFFLTVSCFVPLYAQQAKIIDQLVAKNKILALTFDACESESPAWFDEGVLQYLINSKVPCTIFLSGKFAIRNEKRLKEISNYPFIEFGNHTYHHYQHSEKLSKSGFMWELHTTDSVIKNITGKTLKYFRFPGGHYNVQSLNWVRDAGLQTVHWSFASGDPDPNLTAKAIKDWVLWKTKPGNILIFHINGRGYKTAQILPGLVQSFKKRGFVFKKLSEGL